MAARRRRTSWTGIESRSRNSEPATSSSSASRATGRRSAIATGRADRRARRVICPYDMDWDSETYILDDDLDALFDELPPDVLLEVFLDCCFWGAAPRSRRPTQAGAPGRDVRYLPPPFDIAARARANSTAHPSAARVRDLHRAQRHVGGLEEGQPRPRTTSTAGPTHLHLWGCRHRRASSASIASSTPASSCSKTCAGTCTRSATCRPPSCRRRVSCASGRRCCRAWVGGHGSRWGARSEARRDGHADAASSLGGSGPCGGQVALDRLRGGARGGSSLVRSVATVMRPASAPRLAAAMTRPAVSGSGLRRSAARARAPGRPPRSAGGARDRARAQGGRGGDGRGVRARSSTRSRSRRAARRPAASRTRPTQVA